MVKRVLAFVLWGFTAWYATNFVAYLIGVPDLIGPFVGLAVGSLFFLDPLHILWRSDKRDRATDDAAAGEPASDTDRIAA